MYLSETKGIFIKFKSISSNIHFVRTIFKILKHNMLYFIEIFIKYYVKSLSEVEKH